MANLPLIVMSVVESLSSFKSSTLPVEFMTNHVNEVRTSKLQKLQYTCTFFYALTNSHTCLQGYIRVLPGIGH